MSVRVCGGRVSAGECRGLVGCEMCFFFRSYGAFTGALTCALLGVRASLGFFHVPKGFNASRRVLLGCTMTFGQGL